MQRIFFNKKTGLLLGLVLSFIVSGFLISNVFLANSPALNQAFIASLLNPQAFLANINKTTPKKAVVIGIVPADEKTNEAFLKPLNKIAAGTYAREEPTTQYFQIKSSEIAYKEMSIKTKSGKIVTIRFPENSPPIKEIIELIQNE